MRWKRRTPPPVGYVLVVALYLLLWSALDFESLKFELAPEVQIWYPPFALDVVLLLVFGLCYWPALWLNTFVHTFVTKRYLPLGTFLIFDFVTTFGYVAACALLLFKLRINPRLRELRDVTWFLVVALAAPLLLAQLQAVNFAAAGIVSWSDWPLLTLWYWAGNSTGIGMLAPFLLILLRKLPWLWAYREPRTHRSHEGDQELRWSSRRGLLVLLGEIIVLSLGIWVGFGTPRSFGLDYTYFVFLPLIWVALQHGLPRTTATVLGINSGVALLTDSSIGVANKLVLQFGLMAMTFTGLLLGAISTDRQQKKSTLRRLYQQVQTLNIGLERQVAERTAQLQVQMQQLQQLNQLKDDFLSTVSHELRTPLTNMKMAIQMLQITTTPEQQQRYLQILENECERETTLINELLDLQRLEARADPIDWETVQLQQWLPPIVESFQGRVRSRQQSLLLDIAPGLSSFTSDPIKLKCIVTELLNNACKYTPPEGIITVTVRALASTELSNSTGVELVVCNSGNEIPAVQLTRIFEKFYRLANNDRWQQGGTGLGLAIVQKVVEQLGGQIRAESQSGQITFTVKLPNVDNGASLI